MLSANEPHVNGMSLVDFPEELPSYEDLCREIRRMREEQTQILIVISDIRDKVGPALEAIQSSPVGKMFGLG